MTYLGEHPLYALTEAWVGTAYAIRITRSSGEVVLHRQRRGQPPQGGDYEITVEEIVSRFGHGRYVVEMLYASSLRVPSFEEQVYGRTQDLRVLGRVEITV